MITTLPFLYFSNWMSIVILSSNSEDLDRQELVQYLCYDRPMDQVEELAYLKELKRGARFLYHFSRTTYEERAAVSPEQEEIFVQAIIALDSAYRQYQVLKQRMRRSSVSHQITLVEQWQTYITCIDTLTSLATKDKFVRAYSAMDKATALKEAALIFRYFTSQVGLAL